jgi:hypothetical protein
MAIVEPQRERPPTTAAEPSATPSDAVAADATPSGEAIRGLVRHVVEDPTLSYRQRVQRLAGLAEETLPPPPVSDACRAAQDAGVVCDMFEGHAPYRPRYLLPDYGRALRQGSAYLELPPPADLHEALWFLASMYGQVPSITGYPVYLGDIDDLLAPFVAGWSVDAIVAVLRPFWRALDRMLPDAFVHANLGPHDTPVGRAVLRLERELLQVVPNLTLKVHPEITPDDYLLDAVHTVFACAKPHFVHHPLMVNDLGDAYGVVSCYNSLKRGGGAHTLVRLDLSAVARRHHGPAEGLFEDTLPRYVELTAELIEARVRHLVERARFYEHDWLVREGLLSPDRFSAMFGIYGLAEAVDHLMAARGARRPLRPRRGRQRALLPHHARGRGAGRRAAAAVLRRLRRARAAARAVGDRQRRRRHGRHPHPDRSRAGALPAPARGRAAPRAVRRRRVRHPALRRDGDAQPPGGRRRHPRCVREGMRDLTFNLDGNDFIRITGYLVRKSDLAGIDRGARHGSTFLGAGSEAGAHCTRRAVKRVVAAERLAGT